MNKFLVKTSVVAIAAMLPSLVHAQFTVRVDDGSSSQVVITDGGFADSAAAAGIISWSGTLGGADLSFVTALSKPELSSSPGFGQMDLLNVSILGTGTGTIKFYMSDTSFGGAPGSWTQTGNIGGTLTPGESISLATGVNTANNGLNLGATGSFTAVSLGAGTNVQATGFSSGLSAFSGSVSSSFATLGTFAMWQKVVVKYSGAGQSLVSFDSHHIAAIPEPETYAMLLAGLGLMGFVARRRQRKLAAA